MAQSSVNAKMERAFAGMVGDLRPMTIESYAAEGDVGFGLGVEYGTAAEEQVKVYDGGTFAGFAVAAHREIRTHTDGDAFGHEDERAVGVMRQGLVWCPMVDDEEPAKGGTVYVVDTGDDAGKVRATADDDADEIEGAEFYGEAQDGLAPVVVNLPA